jgi:hypothetical protein
MGFLLTFTSKSSLITDGTSFQSPEKSTQARKDRANMEKISQKRLHEALRRALAAAIERKSKLLSTLFRTNTKGLVVVVLTKNSLRPGRGVEACKKGLGVHQPITEIKEAEAKKHPRTLPASMVTKAHAAAESALATKLGLNRIKNEPYCAFTPQGLSVLHGGCCSPCGEYSVGVWGGEGWQNTQIAQHFVSEMNEWFRSRLDIFEMRGILPNEDSLK